ncbi:MAG: NAD(P)H-dependent oxidoreductase [Pseudomonadota bacterium]
MSDTLNILRVDSSMRREGSITRDLASKVIDKLSQDTNTSVVVRDLLDGVEHVDEAWLAANWTPADERTPEQSSKLTDSDTMINEIKAADVLVIGAPVYNFAVPGALKSWVDMVCRAGETFRYTENGPVGLLEGKRAVIVMASGGTKVGSEIDFASGYLRHIMGFIGITDVEFVAADRLMADQAEAMESAKADIAKLAA